MGSKSCSPRCPRPESWRRWLASAPHAVRGRPRRGGHRRHRRRQDHGPAGLPGREPHRSPGRLQYRRSHGRRACAYLPELDPGTIKGLKSRLDALPEGGKPVAGLRACEEKTLDWFIHKVKSAKDNESLVALLAPFAVVAAHPEGKARDSGRGRSCTARRVRRHRSPAC